MSTVFEPHRPHGIWPDGGRELRYEWVGRTRVTIDPKMGPIEFWREGVEVGCVCDPEQGIICEYHTKQERRRSRVLFGNIRDYCPDPV